MTKMKACEKSPARTVARLVGIVAAVIGAFLSVRPAGAVDAPLFSFVQISDAHLHDEAWIAQQREKGVTDGGYRNHLTTPAYFKACMEWANAQSNLAFIVMTGDMVETATPARYETLEAVMRPIGKPWVLVTGNHDYGLEKLLPADLRHGGSDFHFTFGGMHFVGISSFNPPGMSPVFSKESMEKVAGYLERHPKEPVILLTHSPLVNHLGQSDCWESPANAKEMFQVMGHAGNVVAELCGHDHSFWGRQAGTAFVACAQGFCEAVGVPLYSFLVWNVYRDRMEGVVYFVSGDRKVEKSDVKPLAFALPPTLPLALAVPAAPIEVKPLETPAASILERWFGGYWIHAPGFALPPAWRQDLVLVASNAVLKAMVLEIPDKGHGTPAAPETDSAGRAWQDPAYQESGVWVARQVPAAYWDHRKPREGGHRSMYFRIRLNVQGPDLHALSRCVLKVKSYRNPRIYVNGHALPAGTGTGTWDTFSVFDPAWLKPKDNVIAISLMSSGWGGYKLELELAAQHSSRR